MTKNTLKQKIVSDLKNVNPQKIILFGSLAKGTFGQDSDVDLLVVKNSKSSMSDRYREIRLSLSPNLPFDIFVLTEDELKERVQKSFFSGI